MENNFSPSILRPKDRRVSFFNKPGVNVESAATSYLFAGMIGAFWEFIYVFFIFHVFKNRILGFLPVAYMFSVGAVILYFLCVFIKSKYIAKHFAYAKFLGSQSNAFVKVILKIAKFILLFVVFSIALGLFEVAMGTLLKQIGIEMWNYKNTGNPWLDYVGFKSAALWGVMGIGFMYLIPKIQKWILKLQERFGVSKVRIIATIILILIIVDFVIGICHAYADPHLMETIVHPWVE